MQIVCAALSATALACDVHSLEPGRDFSFSWQQGCCCHLISLEEIGGQNVILSAYLSKSLSPRPRQVDVTYTCPITYSTICKSTVFPFVQGDREHDSPAVTLRHIMQCDFTAVSRGYVLFVIVLT